jgi:hypothetical protein
MREKHSKKNGKQENEQGQKEAQLMGHHDMCPQTKR